MQLTDGQNLTEIFTNIGETFRLLGNTEDTIINENNVYQHGNAKILSIMNPILSDLSLPGSCIANPEHLVDLLAQVKTGKRALILMEHFSNMDLPALHYLLKNSNNTDLQEVSDRLIAIAGMKLNEENPIVKAYASAYSRIVIYPSRSLASITDPVLLEKEMKRSKKINMASMRAMDNLRREGKIVLVFPTGTRFRKDKPETKKGVREIDSYLRLSDIMVLISVNGNCLRISDKNPSDMTADEVFHDKMVYTTSPVINCKDFRETILQSIDNSADDKKQLVVDKIMQILEEQHEKTEKTR
ncbi:MAG: 1-acyl-sn-glycerol-3-phosphate acyltransferase [Treponemataceae bacterium]